MYSAMSQSITVDGIVSRHPGPGQGANVIRQFFSEIDDYSCEPQYEEPPLPEGVEGPLERVAYCKCQLNGSDSYRFRPYWEVSENAWLTQVASTHNVSTYLTAESYNYKELYERQSNV